MRFVDEQDQVRPLLQFPDDVLNPILEHAAEHRAGHHRVHLQVDDLAVTKADRNRFRLELEATREPFNDRRLPDAWFTDQHHRIGALPVTQNLQHLLYFLLAGEDGRDFVLPGEEVQVGGEVLEERRQLEALLEPLVAKLDVPHPRIEPRDEHARLDAVVAQDRHGHPLALLEHGGKQIGRFNRLTARAARVVQRQLEHEPGRRRDPNLGAGEGGHQVEMLLNRLQDGVRIELDVAHDPRKQVPLNLRECEENVLAGQQRMLPAPSLLERAVHDSLRGFRNLAG